MAQSTYAVILKASTPFSVTYYLPTSNKPNTIVWNERNGLQAEVPTKIEYEDYSGGRRIKAVYHENYARFLLDNYGVKSKTAQKKNLAILEFVKELKKDDFVEAFPEAKETPAEEPESKKEGKKHEK